MKKIILWLTVLGLLCLFLTSCGADSDILYAQRGSVERAALGELYPAANAGTVLAALNAAGSGVADRWEPPEAGRSEAGTQLVLSEVAGKGGVPGDTVATDGANIYMVDGYGLIVVSAAGSASTLRSYTRVDREGETWGDRLYLLGDRAAVIWNASDEAGDATRVWAAVLDISAPEAPALVARVSVEGSLVEASLLGESLCLVTQETLLSLPGEKEAQTLLPTLTEDDKSLTVRAGDVYLSPNPARAALTTVAALRLTDGRFTDVLAFTDGTEAVLAEGQDLYLARTRWDETAADPYREDPYTVVEYQVTARTEVKRLRLTEGALALEGGVTLDGALSDPGALDLLEGSLRAFTRVDLRRFAAYTDEKHGWTNFEGRSYETGDQLTLLDKNFEVRGSLTNLGGERGVNHCRFLRANAWMTAGNLLGLANLADTQGPTLCASVEAAGETLILRDLGTDKVLCAALPAEGDPVLTVYDLSNPGNPKELDRLTWNAVPAGDLTARGALFADQATGLIGWPARGTQGAEYRLLCWNGEKLEKKGSFALEYVPENAWTLLLGGLLYVCSPGAVYVTDPGSMTLLTTVSNTVG